ncbi:MAG: cyclic nucleotide-binding/CBS domain-containing protein [Actinomycetes bacterium]
MIVSDAMTTDIITIGPSHSLREASRVMAERSIGSVVVHDPDAAGPGIVTERDVVRAVAAGIDLDAATAANHLTKDSAYGSPGWSLDDASEAMRRGGFRHLVVVDGSSIVGIISMRDIVRAWGNNAP